MTDADLTQRARDEAERFTPTEDLFMEVLAGRHRCGENAWTFDRTHARAADRLSRRSLLWWKWGIVEGTILAGLTDAGRETVLSATYTPPAAQAPSVEALTAEGREFFDEALRLKRNLIAARAERDALALRVRAVELVCAQIESMPIPADPGMSQTEITRRIVATIVTAMRRALLAEDGPC